MKHKIIKFSLKLMHMETTSALPMVWQMWVSICIHFNSNLIILFVLHFIFACIISYSGNNINLNEHSDRFESAYTVSWFPTSEGSKTQYKSSILPWESIDTTLSSTDIKKIGKNASNKKTVRMQRVLLYLASGLPSGCLRPGCPSWHMACWDCTALSSLLAIYKQIIINLLHPCSIILNSLLNVY